MATCHAWWSEHPLVVPEAFAILVVTTVAIIVYIASKIQARNPAIWNAREELLRLRLQCTCLEQRLQLAHEEGWDWEMRDRLAQQLRSSRCQLAHMTAEMDDPSESAAR